MSWFKQAPKPKPPPEKWEVGRCRSVILMANGDTHVRVFAGHAWRLGEFGVIVTDASAKFNSWLEQNGKLRMVAIGRAHLVNINDVVSIRAEFTPFEVEVTDD